MTVGELIRALESYPTEMPVYVSALQDVWFGPVEDVSIEKGCGEEKQVVAINIQDV